MRRLLICILFLAIDLALADYHYVSHSGSDTYPYTSWATAADSVHDAVAAANPGDTVYIAAGEYHGQVYVGSNNCPLAILGAGIDSTHLFTPFEQNLIYFRGNIYARGIRFSTIGSAAAFASVLSGADITVEDCQFSGTGHGILPVASDVIVRDCIFENFESSGIAEPFSTNLSLEVTNCLFRDMQFEPINVETHHVVVRNNIVLGQLTNYASFYLLVAEGGYAAITNNLFHDTGPGAMVIFIADDTTSRIENNTLDSVTIDMQWESAINLAHSFDWRIFNNTITYADNGIRLASDLPLSVHYSNFWNIALYDAYVAPGYDGSIDTSMGILHVDPMFVDSIDFHLQAYSPLIDAGDPAILDVDSSRSDIGAYGGAGGSSYIYRDLAPRIPDSLAYLVWNDTIFLVWRDNYEADFFGYQLHRDTVSGFTPSTLNLIAEPESSFYADADVVLGQTYYYRIASLDNRGNLSDYSAEIAVIVTDIWQGEGAQIPRMTVIESNYPNPFNSSTTIVYSVANLGPIPAEITIEIYDIMGRKVRTLVNERKEVGIYKTIWDGRDDSGHDLSSGAYFARISQWGVNFLNKPKKLVLIR